MGLKLRVEIVNMSSQARRTGSRSRHLSARGSQPTVRRFTATVPRHRFNPPFRSFKLGGTAKRRK